MQQIDLNVSGMTCDGCERSIARAVERLPGVRAVTADHRAGRVTVDAEGVERAAIETAIEDAGYDVLPV